MRLIDADALVTKLEDDAKHMEDNLAIMFTYAAINDIKRAQTVDAVKIIRCEKCEHWDTADIHSTIHPNCRCKATVGKLYTDESFYCGYAERRQE